MQGGGGGDLSMKPLLRSVTSGVVGEGTGDGEKTGLCLRCVPVTAVADLCLKQIRKSKSILLSKVVERI